MTNITRIERLDDTIQQPSGVGDCFYMTWAADDRQYTNLNDGFGWDDLSGYTGAFNNSRVYKILGDAPGHTFEHLEGYPELLNDFTGDRTRTRYYGFGILAVDGVLYNFLGTLRQLPVSANNAFVGVKLIYSNDNGRTWKNQDGSQPVVWEKWEDRSRRNMLFFEEPDCAFAILTVLQMGRDYQQNKDGYVYVYSNNGCVDGKMNQLVMFRVKKEHLLDRDHYEYFVSIDGESEAFWSHAIEDRGVVHTFPLGWVNERTDSGASHPFGWQTSIVYNEPLGVYMMAAWGNGVNVPTDPWFTNPSYLGFYISPTPWGPWTQVHEETEWLPGGNPLTRAYTPQIAPKWIAEDGRSFWLVWTDFQRSEYKVRFEDYTFKSMQRKLPYYAFNCQKVLIHMD